MKAKIENKLKQAKEGLELQYASLPPRKEVLDRVFGKELRPRKSLDITPAQLAFALRECATSRESERADVEKKIAAEFYKMRNPLPKLAVKEHGLALGLCVRTIYESTLLALRLPRESVVLMSAVTIQDMVTITEAHGLKVIAVDINLDTLIPDASELEMLCIKFQDRAKVFVLAHLFGARTDVSELIKVCRQHNVTLVEDCAESWAGPGTFIGNDESDLVLFSFGTIKTATALGGAIGRFRSPKLLNDVKAIMNQYPVRSISVDASRFAKYAALNQLTSSDRVFGAVVRGMNKLHLDHDKVIRDFSRGFSRDKDLFIQMRLRPTVPTLKLILKRMQEFDFKSAEQRRVSGKHLTTEMRDALGIKDLVIPGDLEKLVDHEYWLFPVSVRNPDVDLRHVEARMFRDGFDVTGGTTQLASLDMVVMDPADSEFTIPRNARLLMSRILYLPLGDGSGGPAVRRRMIKSLGKAVGVLDDDEDEDEDDDDDGGDVNADAEENELEWVDSDDEDVPKPRPVKAKL